jgi:small-conductance mechanosensitive channel
VSTPGSDGDGKAKNQNPGRIAVDLQEQRQLDLTRQVKMVKARTRPWRAIIALVLAIAASAVSYAAGHRLHDLFEPGHTGKSIVAASAAGAFLVFGLAAVVGLAGKSRQLLQPVAGSAHAAIVRYTIVLAGAILTLTMALALVKIPVGQLIVGGALTTILIGIAAQQSLSNVFAGIVLLLARPFGVDDSVLLRSGALGGLLEGTVTEIGIAYVQLDTDTGIMSLPNSQVLAAGVSRRPVAAQHGDRPDGQPLPPPADPRAAGTLPASLGSVSDATTRT